LHYYSKVSELESVQNQNLLFKSLGNVLVRVLTCDQQIVSSTLGRALLGQHSGCPSVCGWTISVCNRSPRSTQPSIPPGYR